ncbi:MAG: DUF1376 domain-containing protein [Xanthobacteraceae bacterium]
MGDIKWVKWDPTAALDGMSELTLEERGALTTVLNLIYAREGAVDDDARFIAGWLRVDVRVWHRIRQRLVNLNKLYVNDRSLRNARADREVDAARDRIRKNAEAGLASAAKRDEIRSFRNVLASTPVERSLQRPTSKNTKKATLTSLSSEYTAARAREESGEEGEGGQAAHVEQHQTTPPKRPSDLSRAEFEEMFQARKR